LSMFKGKTVYVCYDCDNAGRKSSRSIAFKLHNAGANVHIVDLALTGTKEEKDITDAVVKLKWGAAEIQAKIDAATLYTEDLFSEDKNEHFPLVDLWEVPQGRYAGRMISSRVVLSGKYDSPMQTPSAVEWKCFGPILDKQKN